MNENPPSSELDLSKMYKILAANGEAWNLVSHASARQATNALNIAFPAFQCEYWCTCFSPESKGEMTIKLTGSFPSWAEYAALTFYDSSGAVLLDTEGNEVSINFKQSGYEAGNPFCWAVNISEPCIILNRIYTAKGKRSLSEKDKFHVTVDSQALSTAPATLAYTNGKTLEGPLQFLLGHNLSSSGNTIQTNAEMYKPPNSALPGLFPNANAVYILAHMAGTTNCLQFEGEIPTTEENKMGHYDFYGFMAVDLDSTATIQSINQSNMGGWGSGKYTLYFARTEDDALAAGYDKDNPRHVKLLLETDQPEHSANAHDDEELINYANGELEKWVDTVREQAETGTQGGLVNGGIICRIINTAGGGTGEGGLWNPEFQSGDGSINAKNCEKAMRSYYPRLVKVYP